MKPSFDICSHRGHYPKERFPTGRFDRRQEIGDESQYLARMSMGLNEDAITFPEFLLSAKLSDLLDQAPGR
jgi:hypothetical protein